MRKNAEFLIAVIYAAAIVVGVASEAIANIAG
jgi:hypothetical protein